MARPGKAAIVLNNGIKIIAFSELNLNLSFYDFLWSNCIPLNMRKMAFQFLCCGQVVGS